MRRVIGLLAVALLGATAAVVPALGANADVNTAPGNTWSPAAVTVNVGDTVTWRNLGGTHDLAFDDGAPGQAMGTAWTFTRPFAQPGTYVFRCTLHQPSMTGQVVVNPASPGTTTGTTDTTPTTTTPTTTTTTTTTQTAARPALAARVIRHSNCNRRGRACPRPGVAIRLRASEASTVAGPLRRRSRSGRYVASGRVSVEVGTGTTTVRVRRRADGSLIGRGSYRLILTATRADGTGSVPVALRFQVRG